MMRLFVVLAPYLLLSCASASKASNEKARQDQLDRAYNFAADNLKQRVESLSEKYSDSKDTPENIAHAVITECGAEIKLVLDCGVNRLDSQLKGTYSDKKLKLNEYREAQDIKIRETAWRNSIGVVVKSRADQRASKNER